MIQLLQYVISITDKYQELLDIERKKCKFLEEILNTQKQQNENLGAISKELKRLTDIIAYKSTIDNLLEL
jgi:16S rRNA G527 N7-methylase RsmG